MQMQDSSDDAVPRLIDGTGLKVQSMELCDPRARLKRNVRRPRTAECIAYAN